VTKNKKVVLVTGGTRGLGLATAIALAKREYRVVATGRHDPGFDAQEYSSLDIRFHKMDLRKHETIHSCVRQIINDHGQLYGLVNNAAIGLDGVLATMHDSQIEELIAVNVTGTVLTTKYALRSILLNGSGRIVNISSIIASTGFSGLSVYAASKAALDGFTRSLAREVGRAGITVNCVRPGYMQTDMSSTLDNAKLETIRRRSPLGRLVAVDEVANAVCWLMGEEASSITGSTVTIDAGSTA
jgi:3-oxoacyl-[acyl-carrier protein] reductase